MQSMLSIQIVGVEQVGQ